MSLVVVDASVLTVFYVADDARRVAVIDRLTRRDTFFAPNHLDAEVVSALRGLARENTVVEALVPAALDHLSELAIRRMPLPPLLKRMWELRHTVTAYDAAYVALAEQLGAVLVTCDARLGRASGTHCAFDII